MKYPYSRGYHYFFNLDEFERVPGSQSYAYDSNIFKSHYSQENKKIGDKTVGELINRKYIGLPRS